jgi:hypothetical protein
MFQLRTRFKIKQNGLNRQPARKDGGCILIGSFHPEKTLRLITLFIKYTELKRNFTTFLECVSKIKSKAIPATGC